MSNKKNPGLTRRASGLMALEQRFMFDGAAVADAFYVLSTDPHEATAIASLIDVAPKATDCKTGLTTTLAAEESMGPVGGAFIFLMNNSGTDANSINLQAGLDEAQRTLQNWANSPKAATDLTEIFLQPEDKVGTVLESVRAGTAKLQVELRDHDELLGAMGAFAAFGSDGSPVIFLNREWLDHTATTPSAIAAVALEEYGHYLDTLLNENRDTLGDEGALFSAKLRGEILDNGSQQRMLLNDDHALLTIEGAPVLVEQAVTDFIDINFGALDFSVTAGSDIRISGSSNSVGETWLYRNVLNINGQTVDAIVRFDSMTAGSSMDAFDSTSAPYSNTMTGWAARPNNAPQFLQPNFDWASAGGSAQFTVSFISGGSYHATNNPGGTSVTLRNVYVNSYDLDSSSSSGTGQGGNQYTSFTNVGGIELSSLTALVTSVAASTTTIEPNSASSPGNITYVPSTEDGDKYRVRVSFDEVSTFSYKVGARTGAGIAYYAIDFSEGPTFTNLASYDLILAGGAVVTSESGTNDTFTLKLSSQPSANVIVTLTGLDGSEGALSTTSLTFTTSNWNTAQTVSVTGQSDAITDGDISYTLKATAASTDARFQGASVLIDVTNLDTVADTTPPTASIVVTDTALKVGETSLVTITFSEAVTGFTNADLTIANGTLSAVSSSDGGITWTATFTPTASVEDATNLITLDNTGVADVSGNAGTGTTNSNNYGIDTLRPTIAIASNKTSLAAGDTATITFTLSEAVTDFASGDVTVSGGALSNFTGSGTSYSATFTPDVNSTSNGVLTVSNTKFTDAAGNANTDGADANNTVTMTVIPPISVTGGTYNEASPRAVFTVDAYPGQVLTLDVQDAADTGKEPTGANEGGDSVNGDALNNAPIYYSLNGGANWALYSGPITAGAADVLVAVDITNETDTFFESEEQLKLVVNAGQVTESSAYASIKDDGTGTITAAINAASTNITSPATDLGGTNDDDRPLTVSSFDVNEGSPYAVFTVTGGNNQQTTLSLANQNGDGDNLASLQYFDGTTWQPYTTSQVVSLNGTSLLVRVALSPEQEAALDGPETFNLVATNTGGTVSTGGLGTIKDDGTGDYFAANNNTATQAVPNGVVLDDDSTLTVNSFDVNEGSPYAVFTVSGAANQLSTLALAAGTTNPASADGGDYGLAATGSDLQVWNGSGWVDYTAGSTVALNTNSKLLVRAVIVNDSVADNNETFKLSATNTGGTAAQGTATIKDDGTGTLFTDGNPTGDTPTANANGPFDDDRVITVSGLDDVSEGSNAIFTVALPDGNTRDTEISLALSHGSGASDAEANDYSSTFTAYYFVGDTKTNLTITDGKITLPSGVTSFIVSVPTTQDTDFEGAENFSLTATITGGKNGSDTSTILDDGTGRIYDDRGTNATGPGDDDRPKPAPVLTPPPAPAPAAPSLTPITLTPVPAAPPSFASTLAPLAPAIAPAEPPAPLADTVTSSSGIPIPVSETAPPGLSLYQGITDQFVQSTDISTKVSLPFDAFIHSNKDAVVKLQAKQADDSNLPNWVQFDATSGVFEVTPPKGFKGKLDLKVIARDDDGREAVAIFQMFIGEQTTDRPQSRDSFTDKLRMAGNRPVTLVRVVDTSRAVAAPATVREAPAVKAVPA